MPKFLQNLQYTYAPSADYFEKIIHDQFQKDIGHKTGEDQSGFILGRSCTDSLFIIQQIEAI